MTAVMRAAHLRCRLVLCVVAPIQGGLARESPTSTRAGPFYFWSQPIMVFRTRSKRSVLNDLVAKLEVLPTDAPDRPHLIRMINSLRRELERGPPPAPR